MKNIHKVAGFSKILFGFALLFIVMAASLFFWGVSAAETQSDPQELMKRIGQVAGGLGGIGIVFLVISVFKRSKPKTR